MTKEKKLILNLLQTIKNANWQDTTGHPNLSGPTPNMIRAITEINIFYDLICRTCNQAIQEEK